MDCVVFKKNLIYFAESPIVIKRRIWVFWSSTRWKSNSFWDHSEGKCSILLCVCPLSLYEWGLYAICYCSELVAELPFTLMHPKPLDEDRPSSSSGSHKSESSITNKENGESSKPSSEQKIVDDLVDTNLIQLDPWVQTQNWNNT